jgi:hypothetical protein
VYLRAAGQVIGTLRIAVVSALRGQGPKILWIATSTQRSGAREHDLLGAELAAYQAEGQQTGAQARRSSAIQDTISTAQSAEVDNLAVRRRNLPAISPVPQALSEGAGGAAEAMEDCGPLLHLSCAFPIQSYVYAAL